ncbi:hypothetical protein VTK73DRAFT_4363 [Phialemonium thermophilum]|uniref:Transposase n=1 Tax=Phialemonium thermophilum TaxID=223376 RepID=A0ABR3XZ99_9PEZI
MESPREIIGRDATGITPQGRLSFKQVTRKSGVKQLGCDKGTKIAMISVTAPCAWWKKRSTKHKNHVPFGVEMPSRH